MGDGQDTTNNDIYNLLQDVIKTNQAMKDEIKQEIRSIKEDLLKEVQSLKQQNADLEQQNQYLNSRLLATERKQKKYNLVIYGLKEVGHSPVIEIFLEVINKKLGLECSFHDVRDIYRIGKAETGKPRPIVVEVVNYPLKLEILQNCKKLKGTGIYVAHDYTPEDYERQKVLVTHLKQAKANNYQAKIKNDVLIVNGDRFTYEDLLNEKKTGLGEKKEIIVKNVKEIEKLAKEKKETAEETEKLIESNRKEMQTASSTDETTNSNQVSRNKKKTVNENPIKRSGRLKSNALE